MATELYARYASTILIALAMAGGKLSWPELEASSGLSATQTVTLLQQMQTEHLVHVALGEGATLGAAGLQMLSLLRALVA